VMLCHTVPFSERAVIRGVFHDGSRSRGRLLQPGQRPSGMILPTGNSSRSCWQSSPGNSRTAGDHGNRRRRGHGKKKLFPPTAKESVSAGVRLPATEWKPAVFLEESIALSFPVSVDVRRCSRLLVHIGHAACRTAVTR